MGGVYEWRMDEERKGRGKVECIWVMSPMV